MLLTQVSQGDQSALQRLLEEQRPYLRRMLEARMEPVLRQRVDPSDIIQEAMLVASRRIDDFLARRPTTFRLWIRRKTLERLIEARRRHFAQKRDVNRETPLSSLSSVAVARAVLSGAASGAARRKEALEEIQRAMESMSEADREILVLRNVEQLSNAEIAELLDIQPKTASKRYGRAVLRLSELMHNR